MRTPTFFLSRRAARGFTLIELLIAMVLSMVVIGAVIAVFLANRQSYRSTEGLSRVQENVRLAFEQMARDMRAAGSVPCGARIDIANGDSDAPVFNVLTNNAGVWWEDWTRALRGYETGTAFPGATVAVPQAADIGAGSDALQTISGSGSGMSVASHDATAHAFTLRAAGHGIANGDIAMVCDYNQAAIFQITNVAGLVLSHAATGTAPGNCSSRLGIGLTTTWCDSDTNTPARSFDANSLLVHVAANGWYLGCNGRGATNGSADCTQDAGRSLYRTTLQSNGAGGVSVVPEEIIDGVRGLKIQYLTNAATTYVDASAVTDWASVVSAKLQITLSTLDTGLNTNTAASTNASRVTRDLNYVVNLRNRVL